LIFDSGATVRPAVFRRTPSGVSRTLRRSSENSISFSRSNSAPVVLVIRGAVQCGQISRKWNVISPSVMSEYGFEWSGKRTVILACALVANKPHIPKSKIQIPNKFQGHKGFSNREIWSLEFIWDLDCHKR